MNNLEDLLDKSKIVSQLEEGIYLTDLKLKKDVKVSQEAWLNIYNFDINSENKDRIDFFKTKLAGHMQKIEKYHQFKPNDVYLEIGCGPSYVAEHLMNKHDVCFIGIDFNLNLLKSLKKYLEQKGFSKFLLICADINEMPIKDESIDFVYGGGVIEHFSDTKHILKELNRVLKKGGV